MKEKIEGREKKKRKETREEACKAYTYTFSMVGSGGWKHEESMNRNNRLDIRSLRPWAMAKEIKEVKVERREEEKRQSWQKGQNHARTPAHSSLLSSTRSLRRVEACSKVQYGKT